MDYDQIRRDSKAESILSSISQVRLFNICQFTSTLDPLFLAVRTASSDDTYPLAKRARFGRRQFFSYDILPPLLLALMDIYDVGYARCFILSKAVIVRCLTIYHS